MKRKFTLNDLFLYHYNELSPLESESIEAQIASDELFQRESHKIKQMKACLNDLRETPSQTSIDIILDYDRKSSNELAY